MWNAWDNLTEHIPLRNIIWLRNRKKNQFSFLRVNFVLIRNCANHQPCTVFRVLVHYCTLCLLTWTSNGNPFRPSQSRTRTWLVLGQYDCLHKHKYLPTCGERWQHASHVFAASDKVSLIVSPWASVLGYIPDKNRTDMRQSIFNLGSVKSQPGWNLTNKITEYKNKK